MTAQGLEQRVTSLEQTIESVVTRDELADVLKSLHVRLDAIGSHLVGIDGRLDSMDRRFDGIDGRLDVIDGRLDSMDRRFDGIDGRLDVIDGRLDSMDRRFDGMDDWLDGIDRRLDGSDDRFTAFLEEQRRAYEADGKAWEILAGQMTMAEADREQFFIKIDAIQTALGNRGIGVD